jgi:hypothetical protein
LHKYIYYAHYLSVYMYIFSRVQNLKGEYSKLLSFSLAYLFIIIIYFFYNYTVAECWKFYCPPRVATTRPRLMKIIPLLYVIETPRSYQILFRTQTVICSTYYICMLYILYIYSLKIILFPRCHYYLQISCCNNNNKKNRRYYTRMQ